MRQILVEVMQLHQLACMKPSDALGLGEQMLAYEADFYNGNGDRTGKDGELVLRRELQQNNNIQRRK